MKTSFLNYDFEETVNYGDEKKQEEKKVRGNIFNKPLLMIYPPDPPTYGVVHLSFEYFYEFVRGTRIV